MRRPISRHFRHPRPVVRPHERAVNWPDLVIIPTKTTMKDLERVKATYDLIQKTSDKARTFIVINQTRPQAGRLDEPMKYLTTRGFAVCPHSLGYRVAFEDADEDGHPAEIEPQGKAAAEIQSVYRYTIEALHHLTSEGVTAKNLAARLHKQEDQEAASATPGRCPARHAPRRAEARARTVMVNIAAWFPVRVKFELEEIRLERSRKLGRKVTSQEILAEAYNDLFKNTEGPNWPRCQEIRVRGYTMERYPSRTAQTPPESVDKNKQYDLFTTFFSKDQRDLSNTIELGTPSQSMPSPRVNRTPAGTITGVCLSMSRNLNTVPRTSTQHP